MQNKIFYVTFLLWAEKKIIKENRLYKEHLEEQITKRTEELNSKSELLVETNSQLLIEISELYVY